MMIGEVAKSSFKNGAPMEKNFIVNHWIWSERGRGNKREKEMDYRFPIILLRIADTIADFSCCCHFRAFPFVFIVSLKEHFVVVVTKILTDYHFNISYHIHVIEQNDVHKTTNAYNAAMQTEVCTVNANIYT